MKKYLTLIIISVMLLTGCHTKTYTVTFNIDNDNIQKVSVSKGDYLSDVEVPSKEGYIFVSWLKDGREYELPAKVEEDLDLTAYWIKEPEIINKYTVTFDFGDYQKTKTAEEGKNIDKPMDPMKENYNFLGWYYQDELYDFSKPVNNNITLTAKYQKVRFKITFDLDGGSGIKETEVNYGEVIPKPKNPTKFGYDFSGWIINDSEYDFNTPIYEDTTLKATWIAKEYYKVTFDTDGGTKIASEIIFKGDKIKNSKIPVKEGYTFIYWSLDGEEFDMTTEITKNIKLKAIYEKK